MSKEKTLEMFLADIKLREEAFTVLDKTPDNKLKKEFALQEEITNDKFFLKFEVERSTYQAAVMRHRLKKHKEAKRAQKEFEQSPLSESVKPRIVQALQNNTEEESSEDEGGPTSKVWSASEVRKQRAHTTAI